MRRCFPAAALALACLPAPLRAQFTDPAADWRTARTADFAVHYPQEMAEWTLPMVRHLQSIRSAVDSLVGFAPPLVDVVVTDPLALSNGITLPYLGRPLIVLWPTPPTPRLEIGEHRGWAELLAVHEFAHVAHLTRPSRNPVRQLLWDLSPLPLGPLAREAPRWLTEGYATYVEGRLTGSGRPNGVLRPAVLRQWALEGKLPGYAELSGTGGYRGGSMAYLVGSAFIEWLVEQRGEESLRDLWRRMTARRTRSFAAAFAGVYGGAPEDLYDRFVVSLTGEALAVRARLAEAGLVVGDTLQVLPRETGDPALSPDGSRLALVLARENAPRRVVVWKTAPEPVDSAELRRRDELLRRDPLDVPAIEWRPRPRKPVAELYPYVGAAYSEPRFLPDGRHLLVVRDAALSNGQLRPDLFVWDSETGAVRRVTEGAGIRGADPAPDGRSAVAVRCLNGICDLVRVELADGSVAPLLRGSPERVFYRPRVSPDGAAAAVAVQEAGRWRIAVVPLSAPALLYVDPDDGVDRYDAAFAADGRSLVLVSHRGGIPNLERLELATGAVAPLTRVTGAAFAPEPDRTDGSVYFLSLTAHGLNLDRLTRPRALELVAASPADWPAAPLVTSAGERFAARPPLAVHPYGAGPRIWRWTLGESDAPASSTTTFGVVSTDPVGRLALMLEGAVGSSGGWEGLHAGVGWRGWGPTLRVEAFGARNDPLREGLDARLTPPRRLRYDGALLLLERARSGLGSWSALRLGGSSGSLRLDGRPGGTRTLGFAEAEGGLREGYRGWRFSQSLWLRGGGGATLGAGWRRWGAGLGGRWETATTTCGCGRRRCG